MSARCDRSVELATLIDYWFDERGASESDALEEHLFECESCSERLRGLAALGEGVRRLAHEGAIGMVVTPSFLQKAAREGLRIREYHVPSGAQVACTMGPDDDLLVGHIEGDFRGVSRLDVVWQFEGESERRVEDVPVDPDARELIFLQPTPVMRLMGRVRARLRLLAREPGGERVVGEYVFDHTPPS